MTAIAWDQTGEKTFETGVDRGVLYSMVSPGVPWNGLVSVNEKSAGGESDQYHFDGVKYLDLIGHEDYQATLTAFTYPEEFLPFDGVWLGGPGLYLTRQRRETFGLSYRTKVGNDVEGAARGYKIHLVYNITASPSTKANNTMAESVDPLNFQWELNAVPPPASTYKPTAHLIIDSTEISFPILEALEEALYGTGGTDAYLPTQDFIIELLTSGDPDLVDGGAPDWPDDDIIDGGGP
jgi:hypothetical protein